MTGTAAVLYFCDKSSRQSFVSTPLLKPTNVLLGLVSGFYSNRTWFPELQGQLQGVEHPASDTTCTQGDGGGDWWARSASERWLEGDGYKTEYAPSCGKHRV